MPQTYYGAGGYPVTTPYPYNPTGYPYYGAKQEVTKVNGRNGAEAYALAPNSSALLLDETAPIVWLVMTDGAGYKTVTGYDITPAQSAEQKEASRFDALEQRITALEAALNGKPDPANT